MHIETAASPQLPGRHGHGREGRSGQLNTLNYSRLSPPFFDTAPPTSISPTAPASSSGLVIKSSRPRNHDAKPYDRPQSALGTGSKTPTVPLRQTQDGSRKHSASHRTVSAGSSRPATAQHPKGTPSPIPSAHEEQPGKSYIIRADVYVDPESKVFTALLELPGVRREEVRVTLSSCVYNGVKQVTVSGRTRDPFSASEGGQGLGKIVRERKYGRFIRTFAVSSDTKLEDVDVSMDDGLLLLRVQNRPDIVNAQVQEVPIR
ncbi:hypothetical protein APHAL10511_002466 [Amanita phalloides]|nr:hypothetical protein APHAL10511_002466 [Amanita phalloides]